MNVHVSLDSVGPKRPLCGLLHLVGALFSILGTIMPVHKAGTSAIKQVSFYIYGTTLVVIYLAVLLCPRNHGDARAA